MQENIKDQEAILKKLGIEQLNEMQQKTHKAIANHQQVVLLSPTGTGKTLAFLLPIIASLDPDSSEIQVLILVPSRELAIQIEQVTRTLGSGFKINAVYGGRSGSTDRLEMRQTPAILIGTPGRVADHIRRESINVNHLSTLVLDEFDKSLEVGFATEMQEIVAAIPAEAKKILTSATQKVKIPPFIGLTKIKHLNFLSDKTEDLKLKLVISTAEDKLDSLVQLLSFLGNQSGIIFCNFKDSIQLVSDLLTENSIGHTCFYGGLEQVDRERALIKFRNRTHRILLATDLAARGIDVPQLDYIIHYQLPVRPDEFIHRNGRTARMHSEGTAYILKWNQESLPAFIKEVETLAMKPQAPIEAMEWDTLYISGGRKDKISKGDIAGLFLKQGNLTMEELGLIELKHDCSYVSVPKAKSEELIQQLNNSKIKKRKVRINRLG